MALPHVRSGAATSALPPGPKLPTLVQTVLLAQCQHWLLPRMRRRYGDMFTMRSAPDNRTVVFLADPEHIGAVFGGSPAVFHGGEGNKILESVLGSSSVFLTDDERHRRLRKVLMPAFGGQALRGYGDVVAKLAADEVATWRPGRVFAVHHRMDALALDIMLHMLFGDTEQERLTRLRPLVRRLVDVGPILMLGWAYPGLRRYGPWRRYAMDQERLDALLYEEIAERGHTTGPAERGDVLSRLLNAGGADQAARLSDAELRDQLVTLLVAGHETSATALSWALHELARRPEQLRAAQRAADNGDEDYLVAVGKEALRIRPVVYEVLRYLTEPAKIGDYLLPAGVMVAPCGGLVQSDPDHHPEPGEFRPERFLGEHPSANTWLPFGGGAHRCAGAAFAQIELAIVLGEILRRYDIAADRSRPEPVKARNTTLVPLRGCRIRVTPRRK